MRWLDFVFERGNDGLIFMPPWVTLFRKVRGWTTAHAVAEHGPFLGLPIWIMLRVGFLAARFLDLLLSLVIWGWGSPVRYYNLFCRQVWVVFERQ